MHKFDSDRQLIEPVAQAVFLAKVLQDGPLPMCPRILKAVSFTTKA